MKVMEFTRSVKGLTNIYDAIGIPRIAPNRNPLLIEAKMKNMPGDKAKETSSKRVSCFLPLSFMNFFINFIITKDKTTPARKARESRNSASLYLLRCFIQLN